MSIAKLFDSIAGSYDRFNHLLSLNIDVLWRRSALRHLPQATHPLDNGRCPKDGGVESDSSIHSEKTVRTRRGVSTDIVAALDVACGTGDFSIELIKSGTASHVTGVDISTGMLEKGKEKVKAKGYEAQIDMQIADCAALPFPDQSFDLVTCAFGVRNFEHRAESLREMHRVLKDGGRLLILEFSQPKHFPVKQLYRFYFKHVMPNVGAWLSGNKAAYNYFYDSVYRFPQGADFMHELQDAGFSCTTQRRMTFGIATAYYSFR